MQVGAGVVGARRGNPHPEVRPRQTAGLNSLSWRLICCDVAGCVLGLERAAEPGVGYPRD